MSTKKTTKKANVGKPIVSRRLRYSIAALTIQPKFKWEKDQEGDWQLSFLNDHKSWSYWGMVCPHHKGYHEIVWDGNLSCHMPKTLREAKRKAEEMCAGDILRDLSPVTANGG